MSEDPGDQNPRRLIRRPRGLSFSNSTIGNSTSGARDVSSEVEGGIGAATSAQPQPQPASLPDTQARAISDDFNPADRLRQVRARASSYEREYRLDLLHRLLMRKVPLDEIAVQLGISVSQVQRDRQELYKRLREAASDLDIAELIGDSKGFYDEAVAMSMRAASNASTPLPMRLAAIRTGLAARNDMHRFFQTAGVYDVLRFRKGNDGSAMSDVRRVMENTERMLEELSFSTDRNSGDEEIVEL